MRVKQLLATQRAVGNKGEAGGGASAGGTRNDALLPLEAAACPVWPPSLHGCTSAAAAAVGGSSSPRSKRSRQPSRSAGAPEGSGFEDVDSGQLEEPRALRGVRFQGRQWQARTKRWGRELSLGLYSSAEEAGMAYDLDRLHHQARHSGKAQRLNFPLLRPQYLAVLAELQLQLQLGGQHAGRLGTGRQQGGRPPAAGSGQGQNGLAGMGAGSTGASQAGAEPQAGAGAEECSLLEALEAGVAAVAQAARGVQGALERQLSISSLARSESWPPASCMPCG